jgi:hypothetical protein
VESRYMLPSHCWHQPSRPKGTLVKTDIRAQKPLTMAVPGCPLRVVIVGMVFPAKVNADFPACVKTGLPWLSVPNL